MSWNSYSMVMRISYIIYSCTMSGSTVLIKSNIEFKINSLTITDPDLRKIAEVSK
ncbi:hypothetical protein SAMN04488065_2573 [Haloplanus vescus]|uniref:Uncharacterized protein n=1 Tax=Haloplanus vescus TaxID=555874 RepID=A0A1H3ZUP2_9EURY|nr:hypothetical protein SAMN04488065_2479 [Haloplanus vescus]SEA29425.1 hypothetical protein SAMN04488065_2573 [Haloplanus vescus]